MKAKRIDWTLFPEKTDRFGEVEQWFEQRRHSLGRSTDLDQYWPIDPPNQVVLVEAFTELVKSGHNGLLIILGTERPPWSDPIVEGIKPFLSDRILLGGKSNATDYMHLADHFVLSSLYEGPADQSDRSHGDRLSAGVHGRGWYPGNDRSSWSHDTWNGGGYGSGRHEHSLCAFH